MYHIEHIEIKKFWSRLDIQADVKDDVNIIIGRNGSGKTTFMNILHAILTVDITGLADNDFESAKIVLRENNKKRTITVEKNNRNAIPYIYAIYRISNNKYIVPLVSSDEQRGMPLGMRRRIYEDENARHLRKELKLLVNISSISVYRMRNDDDYEVRDRDRGAVRVISPVDYRLEKALEGLMHFYLTLSEEAAKISRDLQKEVLASILYDKQDDSLKGYSIEFNLDEEKRHLLSAYKQLNLSGRVIEDKINSHLNAVKETLDIIKDTESNKPFKVAPLEAFKRTKKITAQCLDAKNRTEKVYAQAEIFLIILREFISDKSFTFESGKLIISNTFGLVDPSKLSSGEKQLIILLVEALLIRKQRSIFLADEPELSLHIAWQRKIVPAVRKLNPNAQIIVATHSPEVASQYKESIIKMEKLIHV